MDRVREVGAGEEARETSQPHECRQGLILRQRGSEEPRKGSRQASGVVRWLLLQSGKAWGTETLKFLQDRREEAGSAVEAC